MVGEERAIITLEEEYWEKELKVLKLGVNCPLMLWPVQIFFLLKMS